MGLLITPNTKNFVVGDMPDLRIKDAGRLPAGIYKIIPPKQTLMGSTPPEIEVYDGYDLPSEKVYGDNSRKCEKIFKTYKASVRNLGVILQGAKGTGKSVLLHMIANKAVQEGYPVLIITDLICSLPEIIKQINQEVVVIIDEFDKLYNFENREDSCGSTPQEDLLTLLDGGTSTRNLFVVACNELGRINDYLINRPGRFNYLFKVNPPSVEEVAEYMADKLTVEDADEKARLITNISSLAATNLLSYDCLRAIANEINLGYPLEETLEDLNISVNAEFKDNIYVELKDGTLLKFQTRRMRAGQSLSMCLDGVVQVVGSEIAEKSAKLYNAMLTEYTRRETLLREKKIDYNEMSLPYSPSKGGFGGLIFKMVMNSKDIKFGINRQYIDPEDVSISWYDRYNEEVQFVRDQFPELNERDVFPLKPEDIKNISVEIDGNSVSYDNEY